MLGSGNGDSSGVLHKLFRLHPDRIVIASTWRPMENGSFKQVSGIFTPRFATPVSLPMTITNTPANLPAARVVRWNGKR